MAFAKQLRWLQVSGRGAQFWATSSGGRAGGGRHLRCLTYGETARMRVIIRDRISPSNADEQMESETCASRMSWSVLSLTSTSLPGSRELPSKSLARPAMEFWLRHRSHRPAE